MKFCCSGSKSIFEITQYCRFSILKARSYLGNGNIVFRKVGKTAFYSFPNTYFRSMRISISVFDKIHRNEGYF